MKIVNLAELLKLIRPTFTECAACQQKPGAGPLCVDCLERRALYSALGLL